MHRPIWVRNMVSRLNCPCAPDRALLFSHGGNQTYRYAELKFISKGKVAKSIQFRKMLWEKKLKHPSSCMLQFKSKSIHVSNNEVPITELHIKLHRFGEDTRKIELVGHPSFSLRYLEY